MSEVTNYIDAASSVIENIRNSPVEGGFKKVSLAAVDYAYRTTRSEPLSGEKKELVGNILTIGTTINNFYDIGFLNSDEYRNLRKEFKNLKPEREDDFRRYRRELSILEKNRPTPSDLHEEGKSRLEPIKKYREDVNRLSLAFSFAIAFDKPISDYYENFDGQTEEDKRIFEGFYNAVMAMQVVDDIVGRGGDVGKDRPSFYTAVCTPDEIKKQQVIPGNENTYRQLDKLFNEYYDQSYENSSDKLRPLLNAVKFTKYLYPKLTELAKKHNSLRTIAGVNLLTWRDKKDL